VKPNRSNGTPHSGHDSLQEPFRSLLWRNIQLARFFPRAFYDEAGVGVSARSLVGIGYSRFSAFRKRHRRPTSPSRTTPSVGAATMDSSGGRIRSDRAIALRRMRSPACA
jgi:hypothetical protein